MAAAIGVLDNEKLKIMNEKLSSDFEGAIKQWPPLGGLGGFILEGGAYADALGTKENDKYDLWHCLNGLKELHGGKIKVIKELGQLIIDCAVEGIFSQLGINRIDE